MKLAYMAHPLGPDGPQRKLNQANATKWFGWLHDQFPDIVFTANWILLSSIWPEDDEHRGRGLAIDMVHVERADLIFYVGGTMSPGMLKKQQRAASRGVHQVDLTFLGYDAPPWGGENDWRSGMLKELNNVLARMPHNDANNPFDAARLNAMIRDNTLARMTGAG